MYIMAGICLRSSSSAAACICICLFRNRCIPPCLLRPRRGNTSGRTYDVKLLTVQVRRFLMLITGFGDPVGMCAVFLQGKGIYAYLPTTYLMEITLYCHKEGCEYKWTYTGDKRYPAWVTCPNCLNKVKLPEVI